MAIPLIINLIVLTMYLSPLVVFLKYRRPLRRPELSRFSRLVAHFYGVSLTMIVLAFMIPVVGAILGLGFLGAVIYGPFLAVWIREECRKAGLYPEGHCQVCGYDLTGNVTGVCSECGADVIESSGQ